MLLERSSRKSAFSLSPSLFSIDESLVYHLFLFHIQALGLPVLRGKGRRLPSNFRSSVSSSSIRFGRFHVEGQNTVGLERGEAMRNPDNPMKKDTALYFPLSSQGASNTIIGNWKALYCFEIITNVCLCTSLLRTY
jgi:hypothetical protein